MDDRIRVLVERIWDYHHVNHQLSRSDAILVLCSHDTVVAARGAELFLQGWARHDPIHVADMIKALPERAEDPQLKEWLDDSVVKWYQQTMGGPARAS